MKVDILTFSPFIYLPKTGFMAPFTLKASFAIATPDGHKLAKGQHTNYHPWHTILVYLVNPSAV